MLKMRQFQRLGHEVTFLFGTMTGIVGDPSDKTAARQMLTLEQVEANAREWLRQVYRVLDQDRTVIRRNSDWLADLTLTDVIELGSHFTVAQFLERETFAKRMEEHKPIYVHEFLYALMQARDAVELETDVQIGGVDQLFNIMAGRILQRDLGQRPLVVICTPLLVGTDGHLKMSKSAGNYIGMDDAPADMYGKVMSIPDSLVLDYYTLLTEVPGEELGRVGEDLQGGGTRAMEAPRPRDRRLALRRGGSRPGAGGVRARLPAPRAPGGKRP
jgi:tyrosyl-tRNA synthetase